MLKSRLTLSVIVLVFVVSFVTLSICLTKKASANTLSTASVTMSNSRMSYKAGVQAGSSGASLVTIKATGPDTTTNHLFPGDVVCFTDAGQNGCIGNTTYTVDSVPSTTTFNLTSPLANNLDTNGYVVATQSGTWTVGFTVGTGNAAVPIGGTLVLSIPMTDSVNGHDGFPDSGATTATGGFDLGTLAPGNISITGCTPANWGTPVIATGSGTTDHTITWTRASSACSPTSAIVITIGGPGVVNPAPITGHTQGQSDVYGVTITTKDGSGNALDNVIPRAAPVEAVLISATVDESLNFQVAGLSSGGSYCGNNASVSATATSIPWGHITSNTFVYADQQLTVSTNAVNGYTVTLSESDQMGRNGNTCTGTTPSSGNYTFGSGTCIRDTTCSAGGCSESVFSDWTDPVNYVGLGYSLASSSGSDAAFFYNQGSRIFNARELADIQGAKTAQTIMSNSTSVSGSSVYVCYKIAIPGTQPSGYYYNIAKYTATATF